MEAPPVEVLRQAARAGLDAVASQGLGTADDRNPASPRTPKLLELRWCKIVYGIYIYCMYVYVHVCICTYIHICIHICIHTYIQRRAFLYLYWCTHTHIHTRALYQLAGLVCLYMYIHTCVCRYSLHINTYIYRERERDKHIHIHMYLYRSIHRRHMRSAGSIAQALPPLQKDLQYKPGAPNMDPKAEILTLRKINMAAHTGPPNPCVYVYIYTHTVTYIFTYVYMCL